MNLSFRNARPNEAGALTELILRSKVHWGYDEEFMAASKEELTITPEMIRTQIFKVAERNGVFMGTYSIFGKGPTREIEYFFVSADHIGNGMGRRLMEDCLAHARNQGITRLKLDADPHAEDFYKAMGFETIGTSPSGAIPGRMLPHMQKLL